ncbi:MAG: sigma-54 interaction domain-containing protein [Vicinamibacterales bacterium]
MHNQDPLRGPAADTLMGRTADRRRNAASLVAAVVADDGMARDPRAARERLEEELRLALQARTVVLREDSSAPVSAAANVISIAVPPRALDPRARIDALFDGPRALDEWAWQLMEAASHLAVLVLDVERAMSRTAWPPPRRPSDGAAPFIGSSERIRRVRERMERVAATDFTVLIEGESGSGKEVVARQIHEISRRRRGPFVAVNCAAIVETLLEAELFGIEDRTATGVRGRRGKFEHAHEGTLFLDEVSDLSPAAQAKLLRAIQDLSIERVGGTGLRRVDTRLVVATNKPLAGLVADGRFRMDLYYRLHGVEVHVPPLRERREDIVELARYFLERHRGLRTLQMSEAAIDALLAYQWPGNVRELERVMERAVALAGSDRLEIDDLPPALLGGYNEFLLPSLQRKDTMRDWGSRYARLVLERCQNNKRRACRELGISYHTLQAYLRFRARSRSSPRPPGA